MSVDEIDYIVVEQVGAEVLGLGREILAVLNDARMPVARGTAILVVFFLRGMRNTTGQIVRVSPHAVFVEARIVNERGQIAGELPLADLRGCIAPRLEQIGMGEVVADLAHRRFGRRFERGVLHAEKAVVKAILPGHQGDPRGRAEGHGVESLEAHPPGGHPIEVRRFMFSIAVATQLLRTEVVGEDENDIGLLGLRSEERRGQQKHPKQARYSNDHQV